MLKSIILILLFVTFGVAADPPKAEGALKIGDEAPTFYLRDLDNQDVFLRDFCGEKLRQPWKNKQKYSVILSFWATWCAPCQREIPVLEGMAAQLKDKNVKVFLVNVAEKKDKVKPFVANKNYNLPVLLDIYNMVAAKKYRVKSLPSLVVIDPDGKIRLMKKGFSNANKLTKSLLKVINEINQN